MTGRVQVIHATRAEAPYLEPLRSAGWSVRAGSLTGPADVTRLRAWRPQVVVIDLTRAPATGRDIGLGLRQYAALRAVPLVFAGGEPARIAQIRRLLPDALCCRPGAVPSAVEHAMTKPRPSPPRPVSALAGYSGTPLPQKLGIKAHNTVVLVRPPDGFDETLGRLPDGVVIRRRNQGARDVTIWFTRSRQEVEQGVHRMAQVAGAGRLWIAWPKRTSALAADHSEGDVRRLGLATGLVDYKICAVDQDWSGLLFTRRRTTS